MPPRKGWHTHPGIRNAVIAGIFTIFTYIFAETLLDIAHPSVDVAYFVAVLIAGVYWTRAGLNKFTRQHVININVLMFVACAGSMLLNLWEDAAVLSVLYAAVYGIGEFIYTRVKQSVDSTKDFGPQEDPRLKEKQPFFENSTLTPFVDLIRKAQDQKSKRESIIHSFIKIYLPVILFISAFLIVYACFIDVYPRERIHRAITFLVAAAPLGLYLSSRIPIAGGIGKAGKSGILIKGGSNLERLGKIRAIIFDKTGTLTYGNPQRPVTMNDAMRGSSRNVVQRLRDGGFYVTMMTSDGLTTATDIAKELGLDDVGANLLPTEKINYIKQIEHQYRRAAVIVKSSNDSPALAAASVGISLATRDDSQIEDADVQITSDDLNKVTEVMMISKKVRRIIMQNLIVSVAVPAILIPLALIGKINTILSICVQATTSFLILVNGMRVEKPDPLIS